MQKQDSAEDACNNAGHRGPRRPCERMAGTAPAIRGRRRAICRLRLVACLWLPLALPVQAQHPSTETAQEAQSRLWLWPHPGADRTAPGGRIFERSDDPARPDRYIDPVADPYLVVYRPSRPNGRALLVIPGGGYRRVVLDKEGSALVPAFAERGGYTLFVLRYRLPDGRPQDADLPLADAQRAMRLLRAHGRQWGIDPGRIGAMGFSAGGHLAASLATSPERATYAPVDAADRLPARPDFVLLLYPVITMDPPLAHPGSRQRLLGARPTAAQVARHSPQRHVDAHTPPTFLLHAQDDAAVAVENSLLFHAALRRAGVPAQMHVFAHGGHGFGMRDAHGPLAAWPRLALEWMAALEGDVPKDDVEDDDDGR